MHTPPILLIEVRRRRDALRARRQARRVAGLLGFNPSDQACFAALVFELACQALTRAVETGLRFSVERDRLLVVPTDEAVPLRIEKPLPPREPPVGPEDLVFVLAQLHKLAPESLFAEVERQNQDLLRSLVELQACQARLAELAARQAGPTAA